MLQGMGAKVTRVMRPTPADMGIASQQQFELQNHGKQLVYADLKTETGRDIVLKLLASSDILLEGMRSGVMERLGLGPGICHAHNPSLIYGRMTGRGQSGPLAQTVGHDINYIATSGVLHAIGRSDGVPTVPLNLVGDFGAGAMPADCWRPGGTDPGTRHGSGLRG